MQAQALSMQERLAQAQMAMSQMQFDKSLAFQNTALQAQLKGQRSQGKGSFWGGLLSTGAQIGLGLATGGASVPFTVAGSLGQKMVAPKR
jgi:hypothetical protein